MLFSFFLFFFYFSLSRYFLHAAQNVQIERNFPYSSLTEPTRKHLLGLLKRKQSMHNWLRIILERSLSYFLCKGRHSAAKTTNWRKRERERERERKRTREIKKKRERESLILLCISLSYVKLQLHRLKQLANPEMNCTQLHYFTLCIFNCRFYKFYNKTT